MTDNSRNRPGRGISDDLNGPGKRADNRTADPRSRLGGKIPPPPPPPRGPMPAAGGKGVKPAPLAPRKPGAAKPGGGLSGRVPPPPPLRAGGTADKTTEKPAPRPATGGVKPAASSAAGGGKRPTPDVKDFAARLRAQREAAERLINRRAGSVPAAAETERIAHKATPAASPAPHHQPTPPSRPAAPAAPVEAPGTPPTSGGFQPSTTPKAGSPSGGVAGSPSASATQATQQHEPAPAAPVAPPGARPTAYVETPQPPAAAAEESAPEHYGMPSPAQEPAPAGHADASGELFAEPQPAMPPHQPPATDPYAEVYSELENLEEPPKRGLSFILPLVLIFLVVAALAAGAVYLFVNLSGGTQHQVPVITTPGDGAPAKVKPQRPAEVKPAPTPEKPRRKLIYDRIINDDAAQKAPPAGGMEEATPPLPPPLPPPPTPGPEQGRRTQPEQPAGSADSKQTLAANDDVGPTGSPAPAEADARAAAADEVRETDNGMPIPPPPLPAAPPPAGGAGPARAASGISDDAKAARPPADGASTASGAGTAADATSAERVARKPASQPPSGHAAGTGGKPKKTAAKAVADTRKIRPEHRPAGKRTAAARKAPKPKPRPAKARSTTKRLASRAPKARRSAAPIILPGVAAPAGTPSPAARSAGSVRASSPVRAFAPPATPTAPRKRTNFGHSRVSATPASPVAPRVASITPPAKATTRPPAAAPGSAPSARGGYVVQLAAFRSQQDALHAWRRIRAQHGALLGGLQPIVSKKNLGNAGTFYRLSVGPLPSRQAASRLCQRLIAGGEPDCLIRRR